VVDSCKNDPNGPDVVELFFTPRSCWGCGTNYNCYDYLGEVSANMHYNHVHIGVKPGHGWEWVVEQLDRGGIPHSEPTLGGTTGGAHAVGSLHYVGRAVDLWSDDMGQIWDYMARWASGTPPIGDSGGNTIDDVLGDIASFLSFIPKTIYDHIIAPLLRVFGRIGHWVWDRLRDIYHAADDLFHSVARAWVAIGENVLAIAGYWLNTLIHVAATAVNIFSTVAKWILDKADEVIRWIHQNLILPLWRETAKLLQVIQDTALWIYHNWILPLVHEIGRVLDFLWQRIEWVIETLWKPLKAFADWLWDQVRPIAQFVWGALTLTYRLIQQVWDWLVWLARYPYTWLRRLLDDTFSHSGDWLMRHLIDTMQNSGGLLEEFFAKVVAA
jgi:hypothetical protein